MIMLIPIIAIIATFTFVGSIAWAKHRRSERDAFYRHELIKKMAEKAEGEDQLMAFMREELRIRQANRRQGLMVGGLVTLAIGIGFMIGFRWIDDQIFMIGAVPAAIGLAMIAGALLFSRTES